MKQLTETTMSLFSSSRRLHRCRLFVTRRHRLRLTCSGPCTGRIHCVHQQDHGRRRASIWYANQALDSRHAQLDQVPFGHWRGWFDHRLPLLRQEVSRTARHLFFGSLGRRCPCPEVLDAAHPTRAIQQDYLISTSNVLAGK
jgi:hypothetical protein